MKLSSAITYALRAVVHLATANPDQAATSHSIAAAEGMPELFLLKVLRPLAAAGLLLSVRGHSGGYRLARPADKITLLDVLVAVDGPLLGFAPDVSDGRDILDEQVRQVCDRTAELVRQRLRKVTVQELAAKGK